MLTRAAVLLSMGDAQEGGDSKRTDSELLLRVLQDTTGLSADSSAIIMRLYNPSQGQVIITIRHRRGDSNDPQTGKVWGELRGKVDRSWRSPRDIARAGVSLTCSRGILRPAESMAHELVTDLNELSRTTSLRSWTHLRLQWTIVQVDAKRVIIPLDNVKSPLTAILRRGRDQMRIKCLTGAYNTCTRSPELSDECAGHIIVESHLDFLNPHNTYTRTRSPPAFNPFITNYDPDSTPTNPVCV
jgi:hypothetical protein